MAAVIWSRTAEVITGDFCWSGPLLWRAMHRLTGPCGSGSVTARKVSRDCPMVQLFLSLNAAGCPRVTKTLVSGHSEFTGLPNRTWMESFFGSLGVPSI